MPRSSPATWVRWPGSRASIRAFPKSHIIEVDTNGVATTAYTNTLSALSAVPKNGRRDRAGVNDEVTGACSRRSKPEASAHYLAEGYGGDSYGLNQLCLYPTHYVGDWDFDPAVWARAAFHRDDADERPEGAPGDKHNGGQVTPSSSVLHCK